jgi:hypothetical protein
MGNGNGNGNINGFGTGNMFPEISFKLFSEEDFKNDIGRFKEKFNSAMLNNFFNYWKEKSPSGKMKFQLQKTWETNLRLKTWLNNQTNGTIKNDFRTGVPAPTLSPGNRGQL